MGADVVDREDVRMVQCRGRAGLLLESKKAVSVGRERRGQNLDRHVAAKARIARAVYLTHPTCGEGREDFIRTETRAGCQRHEPRVLDSSAIRIEDTDW